MLLLVYFWKYPEYSQDMSRYFKDTGGYFCDTYQYASGLLGTGQVGFEPKFVSKQIIQSNLLGLFFLFYFFLHSKLFLFLEGGVPSFISNMTRDQSLLYHSVLVHTTTPYHISTWYGECTNTRYAKPGTVPRMVSIRDPISRW